MPLHQSFTGIALRPQCVTRSSLSSKGRDFAASYKQPHGSSSNQSDPERYTKSSLMLGPGETEYGVIETMEDMGSSKVSMLIKGHYWQPCSRHLPVKRYITSEQFNWFPEQQNKSDFPMVLQIRWLQATYKAGCFFLSNQVDYDVGGRCIKRLYGGLMNNLTLSKAILYPIFSIFSSDLML